MKKLILIMFLCFLAGCESQQYDQTGYNMDGYDGEGYSIWGYNKDGYNREGFNKEGYSRFGKYNPHYDQRLDELIKKAENATNLPEESSKEASQEQIKACGTGFLLSESGLIATNYHVVSNKPKIQILFPEQNKRFNAEVKLKDISNDLVILALKDFSYAEIFSKKVPYSIRRSSSVKLGETTFAIGFPHAWILGTRPKYSDGTISSVCGFIDTVSLFQISNPIQPGNSGGPLFDKNGNLIGVVVASANAKWFFEQLDTIPQNVNFAVKSDYLINLISMLNEGESIIGRTTSLNTAQPQEQVEAILPYVVIVYGDENNQQ